MKPKSLLFNLLLLLFSHVLVAQVAPQKSETVKWVGEGLSSYTIELSNGRILSVRKTIQSGNLADYFETNLFDQNLKFISSGKIRPIKKEGFFIRLGTVGDKIYLLYYYSDKKRDKFVAAVQELNLSDYTLSPEVILAEIDETIHPDYNITYFTDDKFNITTDLYPKVEFQSNQIIVTVEKGVSYQVYVFNANLESIETYEQERQKAIKVNDEFNPDIFTNIPNSIKLFSIDTNQNAGAFTFYDSESFKSSLQGFTYNSNTEKVSSEFNFSVDADDVWEEATDAIKSAVEKKKSKGKKPFPLDFFYRGAIKNPDNTVTFLFEQGIYKLANDYGNSIVLTSAYHRGVIQTVNVSKDGTVNWTSIIPKKQSAYGRDNLIGYKTKQLEDGKVLFLYTNVDQVNPSEIQLVSLDLDGSIEYLVNYSVPEKMIISRTNNVEKINANSFYLPFIEKKQDGILKFTF